MMHNVPSPVETRKPRAYFAQLSGVSGILTKPGADVLFFNPATRQFTTITPANAMQVLILQEVSTWMSQYYADMAVARDERRAMAVTARLVA